MTDLPPAAPLPSTCVLYHGDCLEVMPRLEANSVDMVFADLPYGCTRNVWDAKLNISHFWASIIMVTSPTKPIVCTATMKFAMTLIQSNKKSFRYDLVWEKSRPTGFLNSKRMPLRSHESILLFYEKPGIYNPQITIGKAYVYDQKSKSSNYGAMTGAKGVNNGSRHPRSVMRVANNRYLHPTQKPVALLEWLIKTYTNEGDTVLDPVSGSNTTAVACARLGRHYIGIEKDAEYFRIGKERVDAERAKLNLPPATLGM